MNTPGSRRGRQSWLDRRYEITPLIEFLRHKEVPLGAHSMVWYYLGGTTLFFFSVQIATGILLLMYYQPGEATAYESIRYITTKVPFGWLVRSVHCWSAHLMIISLIVHMFSTMMLKAYRPPRELTWISGFILFALTLGFGFSGYLLPWNELAFFATVVGTDSVKSLPLIGHWVLEVLRGGQDVTITTLYRFFAFHVVILPMSCFGLIGLHLLFVQRQGMAVPVGTDHAPRGMKFFPNFAIRDLLLWLICLLALLVLAVFVPYGPTIPGMEWELGQKASPLAPAYPGIKPEWYFLWIYQLLKEFPPHLMGLEGPQVCILLVSVLMAVWALIPWLDREAQRNQDSPVFTDFGVALIFFFTFLMLKAWDIGALDGGQDPASLRATAWTCAWWMLAVGVVVTVVRVAFLGDRWLALSGAAVLHIVLHGIVGLSYLSAGAIAAGLAALLLAARLKRGRHQLAGGGASTLCAALAVMLTLVPRAWGEDIGVDTARRESFVLPPALLEMLDARGDDGAPIIGAEGRAYFDALPDHAKRQTADAVSRGMITTPQHLGEIFSLGLASEKLERLMQDNCVLCHSNPDVNQGASLFSTDPSGVGSPAHMNLAEVVEDLHFRHGLSCAGCHGGDPAGFMDHDFPAEWQEDADIRKKDRSWIPQFCSRCHSDAAFMRRFNPALPTDQLAKYRASQHGRLLLDKKDSRAAQCVSCHGVHGIQASSSPRSKVYPKNIPETCGACHASAEIMAGLTLADGSPMPTDQLDKYRNSVHGRALLERGDIGAAVCNDCHGNHAAMPPGVTSVGQICRTCHVGNGTLFDGSKHKEVFDRHGWPECGMCHGNHAIRKTDDTMVGIGKNSLCPGCHAQYAKDNPNCNETAAYFHDSIVELNHALETFEVRSEGLAEKGLDVDLITDELNRLADFVKQARSYVHSFDRSDFRQVVDPGRDVVRKMERLAEDAEDEYRARRMGLLVSVFLIGCVALLLYLKLRRMERPS